MTIQIADAVMEDARKRRRRRCGSECDGGKIETPQRKPRRQKHPTPTQGPFWPS